MESMLCGKKHELGGEKIGEAITKLLREMLCDRLENVFASGPTDGRSASVKRKIL